MASFFYCGRLSSAQLVPVQAPKHRPIIDPHPVEQRDIKDNVVTIVLRNCFDGCTDIYIHRVPLFQKCNSK